MCSSARNLSSIFYATMTLEISELVSVFGRERGSHYARHFISGKTSYEQRQLSERAYGSWPVYRGGLSIRECRVALENMKTVEEVEQTAFGAYMCNMSVIEAKLQF
jgi:hypothetical protein